MGIDAFSSTTPGLQSPAMSIEEVTPSDTNDLTTVTRAINVSASGTVRLTAFDGTIGDIFVTSGSVFPIRARRVFATGTTAQGIRGLS